MAPISSPVSSNSVQILVQPDLPLIAFGKAKWAHYLGDIGIEPPLPPNIDQILNSPCPIWSGKKIADTHLLTLIPQTVNGQPLTLKHLGDLIQQPLQGFATEFSRCVRGEYINEPAPASHWTLLSRDLIPGSHSESYFALQQLVQQYPGYEVPNIFDATVSLLMEHVSNRARLYSGSPMTFTYCQEKYDDNWHLAVGGFSTDGLRISYFNFENKSLGVRIQRKF